MRCVCKTCTSFGDTAPARILLVEPRIRTGKTNRLPNIGRLVRLDADAADLQIDQAANEQARCPESVRRPVASEDFSPAIDFPGRAYKVRLSMRELCRKVLEVTIIRTSALTSHPDSRKWTASQSSNSGWLGEFALRSKIAAGFDKSRSKKLLPDSIDGDAGRQRIFG